jgi:hypothetical protein
MSRQPEPTSIDRPLNDREAAVLERLLMADFPGVEELRCQMKFVRVVGRCLCGCATVDLRADRLSCPPSGARPRPIPSEARVRSQAGNEIGGVIVFLTKGYLWLLEIYSYEDPIPDFPPLDQLQFYVVDRGAPSQLEPKPENRSGDR